jgi:hypothetical protein
VTPLQPAQLGGAQAVLCDLALGLTKRGHEVLIYCAEGSEVPGVNLVEIPVARGADQALMMPGSNDEPAASPVIRMAFDVLFQELRRQGADVVSQHAFDAEAIEMAEGLPVLHTLHMPPISSRVLGSQLWQLMAGASVTLLPVHWDEPFGMVGAEAQMAGCPVAGYARGGLVETVEQGVSGFLSEPGDVKGLAEAALAATKLDRVAVRASAMKRLALDATLDAYEAALTAVAR